MKSRPTNRYSNSLGIGALTAILVVVASLALAGLGVVVSKNRVRALGEEQRQVETEMRLLKAEIIALNNRIETLLTRDRVQPRLTSAGTLLRPITPANIITLRSSSAETAEVMPAAGPSLAQSTP